MSGTRVFGAQNAKPKKSTSLRPPPPPLAPSTEKKKRPSTCTTLAKRLRVSKNAIRPDAKMREHGSRLVRKVVEDLMAPPRLLGETAKGDEPRMNDDLSAPSYSDFVNDIVSRKDAKPFPLCPRGEAISLRGPPCQGMLTERKRPFQAAYSRAQRHEYITDGVLPDTPVPLCLPCMLHDYVRKLLLPMGRDKPVSPPFSFSFNTIGGFKTSAIIKDSVPHTLLWRPSDYKMDKGRLVFPDIVVQHAGEITTGPPKKTAGLLFQ